MAKKVTKKRAKRREWSTPPVRLSITHNFDRSG
jgi:hypothetical protein